MNPNTILIVEDNPDDRDLALRAFKKIKIPNKVVVASDGEEALSYLMGPGPDSHDHPPELPALVLLDLKLPKIDGLEVLEKIRQNERTQFLPVVIMTSSREDKDLIDGYNLGANSYVRKPVDFNEFVNSVQQLGLYWLHLNEQVDGDSAKTF